MNEAPGPVDPETFEAIRTAGRPIVLRRQIADWPAVAAAQGGDAAMVAYLTREPTARPVAAIAAAPTEKGRFFYTPDLTRLNFVRGSGRLESFLEDLLGVATIPDPPAMAVQSEDISSLIPGFARENRLGLLPDVSAKIWIGNRIRVGTHYDAKENVACCVAGRRRFTIYPPDQIAGLYPGPFELTPAGIPVSMVDPMAPDLEKYPRFAEAARHAQVATLEPGDALYIPYGWWHGVESLDPVSILVNYWWTPGQPDGIASPYEGLLHALMAFRHLPEDQRAMWKVMLDYYVFETAGDPSAHLPEHAKGILGPPTPRRFAQMREAIRQALR
ncbi:cupin-like domain-containing protein [Erythrobacter sp. SDW2]|uniref:cupin-like domain-containing protein n=1 Tax=Erythrobacter sp. SDW2 TaxID=2907154 RepID=UPI001F176286|nr:cupin-like domain-containing protein [Erythrobacter sp. SDW2]UIP06076.1 cupin-like domain-containing protein [Erythrobacter sp. SDW2]